MLFDWFQTNSLDIVTSNPFGKSGNATLKLLNHSNSPAGWSRNEAWKDIKTGLFHFYFQEREWRTAIMRKRALQRASRSAACAWESGYSYKITLKVLYVYPLKRFDLGQRSRAMEKPSKLLRSVFVDFRNLRRRGWTLYARFIGRDWSFFLITFFTRDFYLSFPV